MSSKNNQSRAGSALVISSIVIITIAGMAIALTDLTISRYGEQKYRQSQVDLMAATESAANETISWLKSNPEVQTELANLEISNPGFPTEVTSTRAVLVSSSLPAGAGLPEVFPSLMMKSTTSAGGTTRGGTVVTSATGDTGANSSNRRNACKVECKIIKVVSSATPSVWDGNERFIIYTTAETGDRSRPESVLRLRVEAVIKPITKPETVPLVTQVPTPAYPFTRALFAVNGYDFKGTATTDSWISDSNRDGIADTPYKTPASYTVGGPNSNGDVGSNGVLGAGAYDTNKVHGDATAKANAALPNVTYSPPTSGYKDMRSINADTTLTGSGTGTTTFRASSVEHRNRDTLTIAGSGTVVLYVDGAFNIGNINFAPDSTAKLVIFQNDISGRGCSFNAQNTIGDPNNPSRFIFATAFSGTENNGMSLNGGASFSGVVLAPYAGIKFNGGANFYGSFVGKDFSGAVNGNFKFHYDESLAGLGMGTIMKDVVQDVEVQVFQTLAPIAWNVHSVGYHAP